MLISQLKKQSITPDDEQTEILKVLSAKLSRRRFTLRKAKHAGVYIWGPPGRGKSMLMDACMAAFEGRKIRLHFHEFLKLINRKLFDMKAGTNMLPEVISKWLRPYKLICFDEFHVHDIADSVLIGTFLEIAASKRCTVVLTSNYEPDGLFPDPVYHNNFLPSIELIKSRFRVMPLVKHSDYRVIKNLPAETCFFAPDMNASIVSFLSGKDNGLVEKDDTVMLSGRPFDIFIKGNHTIGFRFEELCGADSSYLDYLELSESYDTLFLSDIKEEHFQSRNNILRFIWLLDVLYDKKMRFYASSELPLIDMAEKYFTVNDADRCISRLNEMRHIKDI